MSAEKDDSMRVDIKAPTVPVEVPSVRRTPQPDTEGVVRIQTPPATRAAAPQWLPRASAPANAPSPTLDTRPEEARDVTAGRVRILAPGAIEVAPSRSSDQNPDDDNIDWDATFGGGDNATGHEQPEPPTPPLPTRARETGPVMLRVGGQKVTITEAVAAVALPGSGYTGDAVIRQGPAALDSDDSWSVGPQEAAPVLNATPDEMAELGRASAAHRGAHAVDHRPLPPPARVPIVEALLDDANADEKIEPDLGPAANEHDAPRVTGEREVPPMLARDDGAAPPPTKLPGLHPKLEDHMTREELARAAAEHEEAERVRREQEAYEERELQAQTLQWAQRSRNLKLGVISFVVALVVCGVALVTIHAIRAINHHPQVVAQTPTTPTPARQPEAALCVTAAAYDLLPTDQQAAYDYAVCQFRGDARPSFYCRRLGQLTPERVCNNVRRVCSVPFNGHPAPPVGTNSACLADPTGYPPAAYRFPRP